LHLQIKLCTGRDFATFVLLASLATSDVSKAVFHQ
jgi:hypothetical protein